MTGLIALLMLNLNGHTQPIDTVIRVKASQARKVYADALQKPILEERIAILNERIANYQVLIKTFEEKDSIRAEDCKSQIASLIEEKALYQDQVKTMEQMIRKERRKRFWITASGILTTGAAIYLSTLK